MGRTSVMDMLEHNGNVEEVLEWHLAANHYPPVPNIMVPVCIEAIELAIEEAWDEELDMPKGVTYKGLTTAPVWAIVEQHHLESFLGERESWLVD